MRWRAFILPAYVVGCAAIGVLLGIIIHSATYVPETREAKATRLQQECVSVIAKDMGILTGLSFKVKISGACVNGTGQACAIWCDFVIWDASNLVAITGWTRAYNLTCSTLPTPHTFGPHDLTTMGLPSGNYWIEYTVHGSNTGNTLNGIVPFVIP